VTQTLRCFLREALIGFYRARTMNLVTVGIIAASLAILGGFLLVTGNIGVLARDWDRVQINAYLRDEAVADSGQQIQALVRRLESSPIVREVRYVSREQALEIFRARFPDLATAAGSLEDNPFPASLEIAVRGERQERRARTEQLLADLKASPLVESVQDNEEEARRLLSVLSIITGVGMGVGGVLTLASVFIIFNVIRLAVHSRRDEISIMRLVGATPGFIRGPFLVEGMLQGGLGALVAVAVLWFGHAALADYAARSGSRLASLLSAEFLPAARIAALAAGGVLIGLTGSALSVRRFLTEERPA